MIEPDAALSLLCQEHAKAIGLEAALVQARRDNEELRRRLAEFESKDGEETQSAASP